MHTEAMSCLKATLFSVHHKLGLLAQLLCPVHADIPCPCVSRRSVTVEWVLPNSLLMVLCPAACGPSCGLPQECGALLLLAHTGRRCYTLNSLNCVQSVHINVMDSHVTDTLLRTEETAQLSGVLQAFHLALANTEKWGLSPGGQWGGGGRGAGWVEGVLLTPDTS